MKFELKIADDVYGIPDEYTLGQWAKMNQWDMKDPNDHPFLVADALGIKNTGALMQMKLDDAKQFRFLVSLVISALNLKAGEFKPKLKGYQMIELDTMTFGTWVDLDVLASDLKSLDKLFARLYEMPIEIAREIPITHALPALKMYTDWRRSVYRAYATLFDYNDNNEETPDSPGDTKMTPAHAWYDTIMVLVDESFKDIQYATGRPYREAFNFLAYKKTKAAEERMEFERQKQKMNR